jgi:hypothetical protein
MHGSLEREKYGTPLGAARKVKKWEPEGCECHRRDCPASDALLCRCRSETSAKRRETCRHHQCPPQERARIGQTSGHCHESGFAGPSGIQQTTATRQALMFLGCNAVVVGSRDPAKMRDVAAAVGGQTLNTAPSRPAAAKQGDLYRRIESSSNRSSMSSS